MSLRTVASLLKRKMPSNQSTKISTNRYCIGTTSLHEGRIIDCLPRKRSVEVSKNDNKTMKNFDTFKEVQVDHCSSSVTISWSIAEYNNTTNVPSKQVLDMGRVMKESFGDLATTRPFFVLDGKGPRMALLSLLRQ